MGVGHLILHLMVFIYQFHLMELVGCIIEIYLIFLHFNAYLEFVGIVFHDRQCFLYVPC